MGFEESILIVAPYRKFGEQYQEILQNQSYHIEVLEIRGTIHEAETVLFRKLQEYIRNGKEIVITRGSMATRIAEWFPIKVVNTGVTDYDVLRVMRKYMGCNKPVAVVECADFVRRAMRIGELLDIHIAPYECKSMENLEQGMRDAIADGHQRIITGGWADDHGGIVPSDEVSLEMIESSLDTMAETLERAIELYQYSREEKKKKETLGAIINFSLSAIVGIDANGSIAIFNDEAEKLFRVDRQKVLNNSVMMILPNLNFRKAMREGEIVKNKIIHLDEQELVLNFVPLVIDGENQGAVLTLQKWGDLEESERKIRYQLAQKGLKTKYDFSCISGNSKIITEAITVAKTFAHTDSTVLITGETGCGKELFAQSIHDESNRRNAPFVAINCSALPENLLQSELFGYVDGAFTGARKGGKSGIFELADGGTIFLDEIGEINNMVQNQLLRVIQEREVMRLGDDKIIPVNVRIIAATNRNLYREVQAGNFRSDLYFRLNVLNLPLPPLRERIDDIPILVERILGELNRKLQCNVKGVDEEIVEIFGQYHWPGNIRELQNTLEKIVVMAKSGVAQYHVVQPVLRDLVGRLSEQSINQVTATLDDQERTAILRALYLEEGNKTNAAKQLGINRSTLLRKMKSYQLLDQNEK